MPRRVCSIQIVKPCAVWASIVRHECQTTESNDWFDAIAAGDLRKESDMKEIVSDSDAFRLGGSLV